MIILTQVAAWSTRCWFKDSEDVWMYFLPQFTPCYWPACAIIIDSFFTWTRQTFTKVLLKRDKPPNMSLPWGTSYFKWRVCPRYIKMQQSMVFSLCYCCNCQITNLSLCYLQFFKWISQWGGYLDFWNRGTLVLIWGMKFRVGNIIWGMKFRVSDIIWGMKFRGPKCAYFALKFRVNSSF